MYKNEKTKLTFHFFFDPRKESWLLNKRLNGLYFDITHVRIFFIAFQKLISQIANLEVVKVLLKNIRYTYFKEYHLKLSFFKTAYQLLKLIELVIQIVDPQQIH